MAILTEEERRRNKASRELGVGTRNVLSGAVDWASDMATKTNDLVRNTSPVREIYGAANLLKGLATGKADESPAPKISELAGISQQTPDRRTVSDPDILEPEPLSLPDIERPLEDQPIDEQSEPLLQRITEPNTDEQLDFASEEDKDRYDTLIGEGDYKAISPSREAFALKDASGKSNVVEVSQGSNRPPAPKRSFVSPKRFASRTGFDKDGNPIYNDGSAAMNAANQGIAADNATALRGFEDRNNIFAAEEGTIPLNQARTESSEAQTATNEFQLNRLQALSQAQDAFGAATTSEGQATARRSLQSFGQDVGGDSKRDVRVIKVPDGFGGLKDEIRVDDGTGKYVRAMGGQQKQLPETHPAINLLRTNIDNPVYKKKFQEKYGYLPSWAK